MRTICIAFRCNMYCCCVHWTSKGHVSCVFFTCAPHIFRVEMQFFVSMKSTTDSMRSTFTCNQINAHLKSVPDYFDHVSNAQHYSHWRKCCYYFGRILCARSCYNRNKNRKFVLNAFCGVYLMRLFSIFDNFVIWAHWQNTNDNYCNLKGGRAGENSIIEGNPSMDRVCMCEFVRALECMAFWIWHMTHHTVIMYIGRFCTWRPFGRTRYGFGLWCISKCSGKWAEEQGNTKKHETTTTAPSQSTMCHCMCQKTPTPTTPQKTSWNN